MSDFDPTDLDPYLPVLPGHPPDIVSDLPPDIEEIWGGGRRTGTGALAADLAHEMIVELGEEGFRRSALHRAALTHTERELRLSGLREEYLKNAKKKEKV